MWITTGLGFGVYEVQVGLTRIGLEDNGDCVRMALRYTAE
jgi:hypothetical protein